MSGSVRSYGNSILVFLGPSILFSIVAAIYVPTNSVGGFHFLHTLSSICYLYSSRDEVGNMGLFSSCGKLRVPLEL